MDVEPVQMAVGDLEGEPIEVAADSARRWWPLVAALAVLAAAVPFALRADDPPAVVRVDGNAAPDALAGPPDVTWAIDLGPQDEVQQVGDGVAVLAVADDQRSATIRMLDAATGRERWARPGLTAGQVVVTQEDGRPTSVVPGVPTSGAPVVVLDGTDGSEVLRIEEGRWNGWWDGAHVIGLAGDRCVLVDGTTGETREEVTGLCVPGDRGLAIRDRAGRWTVRSPDGTVAELPGADFLVWTTPEAWFTTDSTTLDLSAWAGNGTPMWQLPMDRPPASILHLPDVMTLLEIPPNGETLIRAGHTSGGETIDVPPWLTRSASFASELVEVAQVDGRWLLLRHDVLRERLVLVDAVTFEEVATAPAILDQFRRSPAAPAEPGQDNATITRRGIIMVEDRDLRLRDWDLVPQWRIPLAVTVTEVAVVASTGEALVLDLVSAGSDQGRRIVGRT